MVGSSFVEGGELFGMGIEGGSGVLGFVGIDGGGSGTGTDGTGGGIFDILGADVWTGGEGIGALGVVGLGAGTGTGAGCGLGKLL